jgi:hypothetical protein
VSLIGLVATDWFPLGLAFAAVSGYALNNLSTSVQALVQTSVEDQLRGRVMSLYTLIYRGLPAAGALVFGVAAEFIAEALAQVTQDALGKPCSRLSIARSACVRIGCVHAATPSVRYPSRGAMHRATQRE